ncbi:MAG TPA: hypothetical protein DIW17_03560 [Clostridiales bacterium]|nr:hypothetical protein [Clostridiales bacterium]
MIKRVLIQNYRTFKKLDFEPQDGLNVIVGNNEAGKSTLLEAITMVLNGRLNGRWVAEELNPYWFNAEVVNDYFKDVDAGREVVPPVIMIEVYFAKDDPLQKLRGKNNHLRIDCPGIALMVEPDPEYADYFSSYLKSDHPPILPIEYYYIVWQGFNGTLLRKRPVELGVSVIDGRTIRSTRGIDVQTRQMLSDYIDEEESADLSVAYRQARYKLTEEILSKVNEKISNDTKAIYPRDLGLQMDQSLTW